MIFTKARFAIPSEAAETQEGDGLTWQDQDLSATLMPDDSGNRRWKYIPKTNFATEEDAEILQEAKETYEAIEELKEKK